METKIITINFKVDEPTINGHIYPKDVFLKALDKRKEIFVENEINMNTVVELSKVIGIVQLEIQEDNTICGPFKKFNTPAWNKIKNIQFEDLRFTTKCFGEFEKDSKIIKYIQLISIGAFIEKWKQKI